MDIKRTNSFNFATEQLRAVRESQGDAHAAVIAGLAVPAAVLDASGIIVACNRAFAEMLRVERSQLEGEPVLTWIRRPDDREAFGREFMGLRKRSAGLAFVRELELRPGLGPAVASSMRACKLATGQVLVTVARTQAVDPEIELGRAVTRALDGLDQGVFLVDGYGRIVHVNPAAQELLGDGLMGRGLLELADPSALERLGRGLKLARNGSWYGELDLRRLDGEPIPVELSIAAGSGEGAPAVVLCRDLRESRRRAFENRLATQVDRALVSSAEPRESVTEACRALATGLDAQRVVIVTHFGGHWERWEVEPDAPPRFVALAPGIHPPSTWAQGEGTQPLDTADESLFALFGEVEAQPRGTAPPRVVGARLILRAPGGVVGHLLITRASRRPFEEHELGLMAQLASQIALGLANGLLMLETRALAAYQSRVLDQTAVLLNSVDAEGRVVTWNRASEHLVGISAEEAKGKRFGHEVAKVKDLRHWEELWGVLRSEGMIAAEIILLDQGGEEVPVHLEGRLLRDGTEVRGAVLVGLNLKVRRNLENQVLRSQKMAAVGLLAAGIAHEINNPLSGVVGYSALLLDKKHLDPDVRAKVEKIAASGERCRKIVEGVLLFSRSKQSGVRQPVALRDLIDRVVRVGEYQWKMHNVRVIRDTPVETEVMADPDQLEQVLLNLLSNAVDAMPRGGNVYLSLSVRPEDEAALLTVADQGTGIPEEIRASIFDPFFSTKDIGKGTGLGLSISYGIVKDHGGDILLESKAGEGTRFTVILPKTAKEPGPPENRSS